MIELQLVGYTADLGHLVLDLKGNDGGRYRLVVEPDLFATLDELREARRAEGLPVGDLVEYATELGVDVEQLRAQQAAEQAALAAQGLVSSGAAGSVDTAVEAPASDDAVGDEDLDEVAFLADEDDFLLDQDEPADEPEDDDDGPEDGEDDPELALDLDAHAGDDTSPDDGDGFVTRLLDDRAQVAASAPSPARPSSRPVARSSSLGSSVQVVAPPAPAAAPEEVAETDTAADGDTEDDISEDVASDEPSAGAESLHVQPDGDGRMPPRPLEPARRATPPDPGRAPPRRPPQPARSDALLTPKQIQDRLRAGRSVASVARAAGTDKEWILRWQQPILAERARILDKALELRLERARLGRSRFNLGESVQRNLGARKISADEIEWTTSRRRDGRWSVRAAYTYRGKKHSATWIYDADGDEIVPASDAARDLGFVRRRT